MSYRHTFLLFITASFILCMMPAAAQSTFHSKLPVKPAKGITVTGTVECDGVPVEGVVVSDGYLLTKTDRKGAYYLKSDKRNFQVFISSPSGFEPYRDDVVPQFWADLNSTPDKLERHDFRLKKVNQDRHSVIVFTDVHLANQRNDVATFKGPYVERLTEEIVSLGKEGMPVYTFNLGDSSWDGFWYGHKYTVSDFRETLNDCGYPGPVFSVIGNHDNDPSAEAGSDVDMKASLPFQKTFGPRYHSQNIGGIHYVFLDNVVYKNDPVDSSPYPGVKGKRNYTEAISQEQLDWLAKDLEEIDKDTPIVLLMHCPMLRWKAYDYKKKWPSLGEDVAIRTEPESTLRLLDILKPFRDVHSFCGHSHKQCLVQLPDSMQNFIEHNVTGVCGAWWRTSAYGLPNLCPDGSPVGFDVILADGSDLSWRHRTFEFSPLATFNAWDMNSVKEYFASNSEIQAFINMFPEWTDYSVIPSNTVCINVWDYDFKGELSVFENGCRLPVREVKMENPWFTAFYMVRSAIWNNSVEKPSLHTPSRFRLFLSETSTPDSPVEIIWKDRFGNRSRAILNRPAGFSPESLPEFKENFRESLAKDPTLASGLYHPYPSDNIPPQTPTPSGYTPFYISHYGRHGSRWLTSEKDYETVLKPFSKAKENGSLTPIGHNVHEKIRKAAEQAYGRAGSLAPLGFLQHKGIAARMFRNYPEVFDNSTIIEARSTNSPRCILSMNAFCESLNSLCHGLDITYDASNLTTATLGFGKLPDDEPDTDFNTYSKNGRYAEIADSLVINVMGADNLIKSLLGEDTFKSRGEKLKFIYQLFYLACDLQNVIPGTDIWEIYSPEQLYWMSVAENFRCYGKRGPHPDAKKYTYKFARGLLSDIILRCDSAISATVPRCDLRFGHDTRIMGLAPLMAINGWDVETDDPERVMEDWNLYDITPKAANIQMIFYKKEGGASEDILVKVLFNEREAHLPVETESWPYYNWAVLREFLVKR